uniref:Uncharacterized protein n=1 Tax=Anguilla anguilla TaxID=7936 RepID=A0A0E9X8W1_ANGAN
MGNYFRVYIFFPHNVTPGHFLEW